ncbi:uncharacterized protein MYCFIDRAFT_179058 [Pseudocercospora fijiensis CIRAD86]|uniref:Uncharacterized protein n=1 Tax=Pseudocercospora fijiensis (strain CIRAD86) TaxID=383855 RepID=M2ZEI1_PSEFD|nr:uncharacterized protein MYCFIDRAFT_179058 [Pseudocercospora fijiensis CIRAD86]EME77544.1 hypothetical protein MYCFIDRAFT_179058 [Pseudocercospora fijiensis CIRAD86]
MQDKGGEAESSFTSPPANVSQSRACEGAGNNNDYDNLHLACDLSRRRCPKYPPPPKLSQRTTSRFDAQKSFLPSLPMKTTPSYSLCQSHCPTSNASSAYPCLFVTCGEGVNIFDDTFMLQNVRRATLRDLCIGSANGGKIEGYRITAACWIEPTGTSVYTIFRAALAP